MHRLAVIISVILTSFSVVYGADAGEFARNLPKTSSLADGFNGIRQARLTIDNAPLHHIEGLWQPTADGGVVAILRWTGSDCPRLSDQRDIYRLIVVSSPRKSVRPGTVMGYAVPTARKGYYDARIFTRQSGNRLTTPQRFTLHLADDSRLSMTPVKGNWRVTFRPRIPYLFRVSISRQENERPGELDGFTRIYPAGSLPAEPRYL